LPTLTIAEDMELTWLLYQNGKQIAYNADTFYFAGEPEIFRLLSKNSISDGYRVFSNFKVEVQQYNENIPC
jgi:hypothetical protein